MTVIADLDLWRHIEPVRPRTNAEGAPRRAGAVRPERMQALRDEAIAIARDECLVQPRASWRFPALDGEPDARGTLSVEGRTLEAPRLLPPPGTGRLTALACGVATIGAALESRVRALFGERRVSLALALDGIGNELLIALSRQAQDRIVAATRRRGLSLAGELRAGDPGLALEAQPDVLALAGADEIGVGLTGTLGMNPIKSTAFVLGVGVDLPPQRWSRCDDCRSRARCRLAAMPAPGTA